MRARTSFYSPAKLCCGGYLSQQVRSTLKPYAAYRRKATINQKRTEYSSLVPQTCFHPTLTLRNILRGEKGSASAQPSNVMTTKYATGASPTNVN